MPIDAGQSNGGCQCGAIRFTLTGKPEQVYACHCRECRKQSASAFGISVIVNADAVDPVKGTPATWTRPTDSGGSMTCAFCPDCGSRLWHGAGGITSVKGGALDTTPSPQSHIWVSQKLDWVILPDDLPQWPQEPED